MSHMEQLQEYITANGCTFAEATYHWAKEHPGQDLVFFDAYLKDYDMKQALLAGARFESCVLPNDMSKVDLQSADFRTTPLAGITLDGAVLHLATFDCASMRRANLRRTKGLPTVQALVEAEAWHAVLPDEVMARVLRARESRAIEAVARMIAIAGGIPSASIPEFLKP